MTIIEVVKSGKPFRRSAWRIEAGFAKVYENLGLNWENYFSQSGYARERFNLTSKDILSDDWEIKSDDYLTISEVKD